MAGIPMRSMSQEETERLALTVTCRIVNGLPAAEWLAAKIKLAPDLLDLVKAGLTYEEVDMFLESESEDDEYRYEWHLPAMGEAD